MVSNKTHYSPSDPEARISIKLGKARALNYHCSVAVDTAHGVISHVNDAAHRLGLRPGQRRQAALHTLQSPVQETAP